MTNPLGGGGQLRLDGFDEVFSDPDRDTWISPKWISDAVGEFDLDCCTNERAHIRATKKFMLERGQDGLVLAKYVGRNERVWCNPPYSRGMVIQFVRAYAKTRFCFLVRKDYSTDWMAELWPHVGLVLTPRGRRLDFEPPPGAKASSNPFPHGLFYARAEDATPEIRKLCYAMVPDHK